MDISANLGSEVVDRDEVDRLRKRFMKLDKVRNILILRCTWCSGFTGCEEWKVYEIKES